MERLRLQREGIGNSTSRVARVAILTATLVSLGSLVLVSLQAGASEAKRDRFDSVVVDAGHGGHDEGAHGAGGLAEKDLVLDISRRLAKKLRSQGLEVVLTRDDDEFVALETRTSVANDARGDLFISIHANSARSSKPSGIETYFVSLESSDEDAGQVAARENRSFGEAGSLSSFDDPLMALLGDMIATEHVNDSSEFAKLVQSELAGLHGGDSRGVKQAPFVVLMGVQMPASLIEIGFLSNEGDEKRLLRESHRDRIVGAVAAAVTAFGRRYDARRGFSPDLSGLPAHRSSPR